MDLRGIEVLLEAVRRGDVPVAEALRRLADLPVQQIAEFAQLDGERAVRQGAPEVIFGERKTAEQIGKLVARLREIEQAVLVTRLAAEAAPAALAAAPEGKYDPISRTFHARPRAGSKLAQHFERIVRAMRMESVNPTIEAHFPGRAVASYGVLLIPRDGILPGTRRHPGDHIVFGR